MEIDRFLPVREALCKQKMCGECVEAKRTCMDSGRQRVLMDISPKDGVIYGKELIKGNIKDCVIFQAVKEKMI